MLIFSLAKSRPRCEEDNRMRGARGEENCFQTYAVHHPISSHVAQRRRYSIKVRWGDTLHQSGELAVTHVERQLCFQYLLYLIALLN